MSEEEAIKYLTNIKDDIFIHLKNYGWIYDINRIIDVDNGIIAIETVLNMLDKKDKIIDLMAGAIDSLDSQLVICKYKDKEDVKKKFLEYFERKVENGN